ncbi:hypothetical protein [Mucilaginibacter pallidiroseus]|uniref:hypothetical protein n=1 Tax=Mucilaginibacter pallidiroseus TaxID=2599295 RepID=UPI001648E68F|nr:hypothetical protein [Mucilaginibacter pallidiroseus]
MRNDMEALYDYDTRHGLLKRKQITWDNYVTGLLNQDPPLKEALNMIPGKKK